MRGSRPSIVFWLAILPILTIVAACEGNASGSSRTPTASEKTPVATRTFGVTASATEARAATSPGLPSAQTPSRVSTQSATAPGGLIFATPPGGRPIDKGIGPVSTEPIIVYPPIPSGFDADGDGSLSVSEFISALRARYPTYDWPSGHKLDLNAVIAQIEAQSQRVGMSFQDGYERQALGVSYICAWEYTLLDAMYANDSVLVAESVERLKTEVNSQPDLYSDVQKHEEEVISRAQLGDPGPLQHDIEGLGCASQPWEPATPGTPTQPPGSSAAQTPIADRGERDRAEKSRG